MPNKPAPAHTEIARGTSIEAVFRTIREMIVYGRLAPGSWIVEADIADKLGISRTPVRHALQWLEHEGYLVALGNGPKSRMTVAPLTERDAKEAYYIVGHMEGLAGRLAAGLDKQERSELVRRLRHLNGQMSKCSNSRPVDSKVFFDLDTKFHSSIVEATAGARFLAIYNGIKPHTERYWWLYASSIHDDEKASIQEHADIISAIAAGDANAAEKTLQLNWENGAERLAALIRKFGERGKW